MADDWLIEFYSWKATQDELQMTHNKCKRTHILALTADSVYNNSSHCNLSDIRQIIADHECERA